MRIPGKNVFGNVVASPAPLADTSARERANINLGNTIASVGGQIQDQRIDQMRLDAERAQTLARAKDSSAYLDHQLQVKRLEQDFTDGLASGTIKHEEAQKQFDEAVQAIPAPKPTAQGQLAAQNLANGVRQTNEGAKLTMSARVRAAQEQDLRSQGIVQLDALGKQGSLPGADVEQINRQADSTLPLLRASGMSEAEATRTLQNFKDANWYNQATQKAMTSRESLGGLRQLEHDLTAEEGFYVGKLDTDKRNAVLNQVIGHRIQLENRQLVQAGKRDASAVRALNQIDAQIASGVPATGEMWADWTNTIKGTSYESELKDRLDDERQVQGVLRMPMADQTKFVQDKEAALMTGGGSVREATNLARLKSAVQRNVTMLQTQPLQFAAERTGEDVEALDVQSLFTEDGTAAAQLSDRLTTVKALQKQFGNQVQTKVLLPQEVQVLTNALQTSTPTQQSDVFSALYKATGDANAFKGMMQQIAPDAPVKAIAGMLAANQAQMTTATHWFKPDEIKFSGAVSATLLQGESMLNASKEDKATDGKSNAKLYLPEQTSLQNAFQTKVGAAFAGRPEAADVAMQAVKAYYVGRAAQTGRLAANSKDIDSNLVKEAITATLGTVVDFNGNGEVFAPWGMNRADFLNKASAAMVMAGRAQGLGDNQLNAFGNAGLRNKGDNTYYVVQGRNYVTGKDGRPLVITVAP